MKNNRFKNSKMIELLKHLVPLQGSSFPVWGNRLRHGWVRCPQRNDHVDLERLEEYSGILETFYTGFIIQPVDDALFLWYFGYVFIASKCFKPSRLIHKKKSLIALIVIMDIVRK